MSPESDLQVTSDVPPTKVPWAWDWQHVAILASYVSGAAMAGIPLAEVLLAHAKDNPTLEVMGLTILAGGAVAGWFKLRPNSIEEALNDGKISVSQATQILSQRDQEK